VFISLDDDENASFHGRKEAPFAVTRHGKVAKSHDLCCSRNCWSGSITAATVTAAAATATVVAFIVVSLRTPFSAICWNC